MFHTMGSLDHRCISMICNPCNLQPAIALCLSLNIKQRIKKLHYSDVCVCLCVYAYICTSGFTLQPDNPLPAQIKIESLGSALTVVKCMMKREHWPSGVFMLYRVFLGRGRVLPFKSREVIATMSCNFFASPSYHALCIASTWSDNRRIIIAENLRRGNLHLLIQRGNQIVARGSDVLTDTVACKTGHLPAYMFNW